MWHLILAVFLWLPAAADTCETVRMDAPGGSLANIAVTQQGGTPSCYAHAAAVLLSAEQNTAVGPGQPQVSPEMLWSQIMALPAAEKARALSATRGRICGAVETFSRLGGCARQPLLDAMKPYHRQLYQNSESEAAAIEVDDSFAHLRDTAMGQWQRIRNAAGCDAAVSRWNRRGLNAFVPALAEILESTRTRPKPRGDAFFGRLMSQTCEQAGGRLPPPARKLTCENHGFGAAAGGRQTLWAPEEFRQAMHERVSAPGATPLGIEYCSGVHDSPGRRLIRDRRFGLDLEYLNAGGPDRPVPNRNLAPGCNFHAATVVGREKREDGRCYFLVQNSWGPSCRGRPSRQRCEAGRFWVEEKDLAHNLVRLVTVSSAPR